MNEIKFKNWELMLKEIICLPYYFILATSLFITANDNYFIVIIGLVIGWYINSLIFWKLYQNNILNRSKKRYVALYFLLFLFMLVAIAGMIILLN